MEDAQQVYGDAESSKNSESSRVGPWIFSGLNVMNHLLVLFVTGWVVYQSLEFSVYHQHMLLCTIGYPLLMSEAIIALAGENVWSRYLSRKSNSHVHWVLQVVGAICSVTGVVIMYSGLTSHFQSTHALLGIISIGGICLVFLSGLPALFAASLRKKIRPVYSKLTHNTLGMTCFFLGMLAQCYAFQMDWWKSIAPVMMHVMTFATVGITLLTLMGAVRQYRRQFSGVVKALSR